MVKHKIDFQLPEPEQFQLYINETEELLEELHCSMLPIPEKERSSFKDIFKEGGVYREASFYGGESAYLFQYRDFTKKKYESDNQWLIDNKGYTVEQLCEVVTSIVNYQTVKIQRELELFSEQGINELTILPGYTFSVKELSDYSGIQEDLVLSVVESFVPPPNLNNLHYNAIDDFNIMNAYPIIQLKGGKYILFQGYSLFEAVYETPFFWFREDVDYINYAMNHRGQFTEDFAAECLERVFGKGCVYKNVEIVNKSGVNLGEVDVLVLFGNRAIILQAKSKKMTILAKKGGIKNIQADFQRAVQDSYNQAFSCAELIQNKDVELIDNSGSKISLNTELDEIYLFSVVSDHYPALSFQARQLLEWKKNHKILPPFVMDVFLLDTMTEMLASPLYFLSYINRYNTSILATHELTVLSYHLAQNLWKDKEMDGFYLGDDISASLDLAMLSRRDGLEGARTPEGILTVLKGTALEKILIQIENDSLPSLIDLGFLILTLNGDTLSQLSGGIEKIASKAILDSKSHDLSVGVQGVGLTFHCNKDEESLARLKLETHCKLKQYREHSKEWFGTSLVPETLEIRFGCKLVREWKYSTDLEKASDDFLGAGKPQSSKLVQRKVGRNEKCFCGSGIKYKKCCLRRKHV